MTDFTAKLPIDDGKVIQLSVVRDSLIRRRLTQKCAHLHVELDEALAQLKCLGCGEQLSPIAYIKILAESWRHYERMAQDALRAEKFYQAKKRCRCEHCGKMTRIRPATAAQVRQMEQEARTNE